jgi:hypothetical protein
MNISISELSTIPTPVFSVWISTLSSPELERESPEDVNAPTFSVNTRESLLKTPETGSSRNTEETSLPEQGALPADQVIAKEEAATF